VLVGSGNPEEGELRPQLLDRFGLSVEVLTPDNADVWVSIVKRRDAYERNPADFCAQWAADDQKTGKRITSARKRLPDMVVSDDIQKQAATLCMALKTDGLRGQLTLIRAARAYAAFDGRKTVTTSDLKKMALPSLRHRLRRNPLDDAGSTTRITRAIGEILGA
jgi:magnesium chelatase subunit I